MAMAMVTPAANLFVGEKNDLKRGRGGEMFELHNIYHCIYLHRTFFEFKAFKE